jgi:hypothetical protein
MPMAKHGTTLELLRKLGELKSESYEINWEEWDQENIEEDLEETVAEGVAKYEERFLDLADTLNDVELNEENVSELEEIIDVLVQGYVMQSIFRKKKVIEDFISTI